MELLEVVLQLARYVEHRVKYSLACRRPNEYSAQIQPIILTPGHGTLPSGHATEAFAAALVFAALLERAGVASINTNAPPYRQGDYRLMLMRLAARIAINRTVAGVHFAIDSIAGALLGLTLGEYFLARVTTTNSYHPAHFDGNAAGIGGMDFVWPNIYHFDLRAVNFPPGNQPVLFPPHPSVVPFPGVNNNTVQVAANSSPPLTWLWNRAVGEWT